MCLAQGHNAATPVNLNLCKQADFVYLNLCKQADFVIHTSNSAFASVNLSLSKTSTRNTIPSTAGK